MALLQSVDFVRRRCELRTDDEPVEGAITMFFAVIAIFMLPDFPHNTRFGFTKEEIQVAQLRMLEDVSGLR